MTTALKCLRFGHSLQNGSFLFKDRLSVKSLGKLYDLRNSSTFASGGKTGRFGIRTIIMGSAVGAGIGAGYSFYQKQQIEKVIINKEEDGEPVLWRSLPDIPISREAIYPNDPIGKEIVLFQYATCPFCCKVRAFLDYHGISYKVVEVNPVLRQQLKWTKYRKVPILLIKDDQGYVQLNDSSTIISVLKSYIQDTSYSPLQIANYYPSVSFMDDSGTIKQEVLNRYFLMYQQGLPEKESNEIILNERKWRKWADDNLVHMLSPNVYRTYAEALQAFNYFSKVGDWEELFSPWERTLVIQVGAAAMYMIGKRLKKRHQLKPDVRESLYDSANTWLKEIKKNDTPFHGGSQPDLADLAVYGVLKSIEGCTAFEDLLTHTNIASWFERMTNSVATQAGAN